MKNKILIISIFFLLSSFVLTTICFAGTTYDLTTIDYIGEKNYNWAVYEGKDGKYYLAVCIESGYQVLTVYEDNIFASMSGRLSNKGGINYYELTANGSINLVCEKPTNAITEYEYSTILYSSSDVMVNNGGLFFQQTPVDKQALTLPLEEKVLAPIMEKVEMKEPIMITIVGLAKLLIPLLIYLLGFWKAWQVFLKILHKS